MRQPDSYTQTEGGRLYPWPADCNINVITLTKFPKGSHIIISDNIDGTNKYRMHSIIWGIEQGVDYGGRWDSFNHWTHPLGKKHYLNNVIKDMVETNTAIAHRTNADIPLDIKEYIDREIMKLEFRMRDN